MNASVVGGEETDLNNARTKILMIAPTPFFSDRGCHVRILEEAKALCSLGHEVHVVTYHLGRDLEGIPTWRIPRIPWYKKQSAGPSWHKPYLDILLVIKALQVARRIRPDIIHAHLHEGAFVGWFLKRLLKVPMIFDCQGSLTAEMIDHEFIRQGSMLYRVFYALEQRINRWADHIVTSSTPTAELLVENFNLSPEMVTPVVDGVDTEVFRPVEDAGKLRQALNIPEDKRTIVFLGAMTPYQGIDLLLHSILLLKQQREDFHFLLMGYPSESYRQKADEMGIADCVTFTGKIDYDTAADYLSLGDFAVSPKLARTEANGKLYNYMACGLPTVVFDTAVNREILGSMGIYAEYENVLDFAARVSELLDDREGLETLASQVRQKAVSEYSWRGRAGQLETIYLRCREFGLNSGGEWS